ncbi:Tetracycline resistance protein TetB/drug resistance transporter [Botryosphaeria dothidea]|uniref:Tetracycline resistance protein TetB/drug resistance transporter n=1 Tax=Botryosphaeria dothidea TaxID=55169 RepID=A0A8H4J3Q5_9PEZI|nr:Tetracycline resistance protein TetB/drug resistance transporter [Botryosphaeria dothidea]
METTGDYAHSAPPRPPLAHRSGDSSSSSSVRLGKRALSHPPAVSELSSGRTSRLSLDKEKEEPTEYPTGWKLVSITLALCCAVFVTTLDQTIVATAAPEITNQFKSLGDVGWYGSAYLLTTAAFQLPFGKLYSILSVKWTFLVTIIIFEIGSLICGAANSSAVLIAGRAIAGVGGAGIFSGALIIAAHTIPLQYRPIYTGAVGAISGIAAICGPLLGGVFTDHASWRWCFYINLPLGGITIAVVAFLTPSMTPKRTSTLTMKQRLAKLDFLGMAAFMPCIISCLLALQWGGTKYGWGSTRIVALFMVSFVLFCCFVGIQFWKKDDATLPPRIMKKRSVAGAVFFSFALGASFFTIVYYLPLWFQAIKQASAARSGVMNLPMVLSVVVISVLAGGMISAWGYYTPFMLLCAAVSAIGAGLLTTLEPNTPSPKWIGYQIVLGVGLGLGMQQPLMAVQTVLDMADVAAGTAVVIFGQTVGGSLILLIAQNLFQNKFIENLRSYVPEVNPGLVLAAGATGLEKAVPEASKAGVLQAYNDAVTTTLLVPAALAAVSILGAVVMEWKSVKGKKFDLVG